MGERIDAAALKAQSAERKNDFPPDKWEILEHIFRVRSLQEAYIDDCQGIFITLCLLEGPLTGPQMVQLLFLCLTAQGQHV
jgi:hypothetical protein